MDVPRIMNMFEESKVLMNTSHCDRLMEMLDFVEYVAIEGKKTELFQQRVIYICMANNFRMAMERDYGRKQIKRLLVICWYEDRVARSTAEKLNLARRVYTHFAEIVNNCFKCPSIDIKEGIYKRTSSIPVLYIGNSIYVYSILKNAYTIRFVFHRRLLLHLQFMSRSIKTPYS